MDFVICSKCSKVFSYKKNLIRHEQKCMGSASDKNFMKCGQCDLMFSRLELLRSHAERDHEILLEQEHHIFKTKKDFDTWKVNVTKENMSHYHLIKTVTTNGSKRSYLRCHRSGFFKSDSKGHRRIKSQGTNKINATCTSSMLVTEDAAKVDVIFYKTHFGHDSNLGRCRLKPEERAMIAGTTTTLPRKLLFEKSLVNQEENDMDQIKSSVFQKLESIMEMIKSSEYTRENWRIMNKKADSLLIVANRGKRSIFDAVTKEPENKRVEKQIRFTSNAKKVKKLPLQPSLSINNEQGNIKEA